MDQSSFSDHQFTDEEIARLLDSEENHIGMDDAADPLPMPDDNLYDSQTSQSLPHSTIALQSASVQPDSADISTASALSLPSEAPATPIETAPDRPRQAQSPRRRPSPGPVSQESENQVLSQTTTSSADSPEIPDSQPDHPMHDIVEASIQADSPVVSNVSITQPSRPLTPRLPQRPKTSTKITMLTLPQGGTKYTMQDYAAAQAQIESLMAGSGQHQSVPSQAVSQQNTNGEGSSTSAQTTAPAFGIQDHADDDMEWMNEEPEADPRETHCSEIYTKLTELEQRTGSLNRADSLRKDRAFSNLLKFNRMKNGREAPMPGLIPPTENSLFVLEDESDQPRVTRIDQDDDHEEFEEMQLDDPMAPPALNAQKDLQEDVAVMTMLGQYLGKGHVEQVNESAPDVPLNKNGQPRKRRGRQPKNAREARERDLAKDAEKARKKAEKDRAKALKSQEKSNAKAKGKGKGKGTAAGTSKKGKGKAVKNGESLLRPPKRTWGGDGDDELAQRMIHDLMHNDDIAERINNPIFNRAPEPKIHGPQRKNDQFRQLYSNIPIETSQSELRDDKNKLQRAAQGFGHGKVKAVSGKWKLKGLQSPLYHHQLLGSYWMVQRELSGSAPYGGILADTMGLGKTIQTLATMIGNPPRPVDIDKRVKATLIVCPATLVQQWINEIALHVENGVFRKVISYKSMAKLPIEVVQDMDVVVTSYHEVMKSFPFPNRDDREEIAEIGYERWWQSVLNRLGVLHQIEWFRVVLDEAHLIKNNNARTSLACQTLKSVFRWCLTGTPLMNRLEEYFPYLRFLKADYTMDWKTFQRYFCDPESEQCRLRIRTILTCIQHRRTMGTTVLGRPIITLPTPHPKLEYVNFSPAEKIIYRITENRFRSNLNRFFAKGDAARNYSVFMVQLLRLRQITSHPWQIERTMRECWTFEDLMELKQRLKDLEKQTISPFYEQTKVWLRRTADEQQPANGNGEDHRRVMPFGKGDFGRTFSIDHALASLNEREMMERVICGICADFPDSAVKTQCEHIFCHSCLEPEMHSQFAAELVLVCPTCEKMFEKFEPIKLPERPAWLDYMDEDDASSEGRNSRRKHRINPNSKGLDMMGHEPPSDSSWLPRSDEEENFAFTPSVKTAMLKAILIHGFEAAPFDKVVIYVQFRTLARIVGRICKTEGWGFLYLTGDSSQEHRHKAIGKFREDPNVKILIAGLKCGGLGLNFPWANRVISLDLWWNHAVEQQAFHRIFRIGQLKETYMTRIVVKQSVDMRLLTMQGHKVTAIEKAVPDGDSANDRPKLSLKELANLFGFLRTDENDNIISVEADYDDMDEWNQGGAGRIDPEVPGGSA